MNSSMEWRFALAARLMAGALLLLISVNSFFGYQTLEVKAGIGVARMVVD